jgi:hypothetical protein
MIKRHNKATAPQIIVIMVAIFGCFWRFFQAHIKGIAGKDNAIAVYKRKGGTIRANFEKIHTASHSINANKTQVGIG